MRLVRRNFLRLLISAPAGAALLSGEQKARPGEPGAIPEWEEPLCDFHGVFRSPLKIASMELLRNGSRYFVRTRTADGATGLVQTKQIAEFVPIFTRIVAPFFTGKDARDLESLISGVYQANYKMAGQPFWCPVAYAEQSVLDLMGRVANKPVADLLGGVKRRRIGVYLSGSVRETTPEEEVDVYVRGVEVTGAQAVKFKIGGRMSRNRDAAPGRTEKLLALARKRLGDNVVLYADANGSYDAKKAIEVGRRLEELDYKFFEEPCPWEEKSETLAVARALKIPIAFGEQDSSLWMFHWMIENGALDIVQPDLNYCGGLIRAARIARMAAKRNIPIVPHNTQTEMNLGNILQFAAAMPNAGPYMEYAWRAPRKPSSWYHPHVEAKNGSLELPEGPGMGFEIDPDFLKRCEVVSG